MPRMGRAILPDYPHHIIQRGHNRQVVFAESGDFERYLETLGDFKAIYGVKVYAWCLMTNHVHLAQLVGVGPPQRIDPSIYASTMRPVLDA